MSSTISATGRTGFSAFLEQAGVDTLEAVFISHPDLDHFGAYAGLHDTSR